MAQLSDDCFAFGGDLLSIDDALALMEKQLPAVATIETQPLAECDRRVLAQDLIAAISIPSFDNSAVDGYAIRHADIEEEGETRLTVAERLQAGMAPSRSIAPGQAVRIFTGAPMPQGADTVYMQEDCRVEGDHVVVPSGLKQGANVRLAGEDIRNGSIAIAAGSRLTPAHLALAAALGETQLSVRRALRVALFSTGDEIMEPGSALPAAALYDSNRYLLGALLRRAGAEVDDLGILRDDVDALSTALAKAAREHDLILTSGGVSTGEADHVKAAVERHGKLVLWRLAIKPGRPVAMGVIDGAAFVGLPGNPAAVFVTFVSIVRPLLARLSGAQHVPLHPLRVRANFHHRKKEGRREFVRATLQAAAADDVNGVEKFPVEGAGLLSSLTRTTGLVILPEDVTQVWPGDLVDYLPYSALID